MFAFADGFDFSEGFKQHLAESEKKARDLLESYYKKCQERSVSSPYSNLAGILITGSQLSEPFYPLDWTGLSILLPLNFGHLFTLRCLPIRGV